MLCGIDSFQGIFPYIPNIQSECGGYLWICPEILSIPQNSVMDMDNVMWLLFRTWRLMNGEKQLQFTNEPIEIGKKEIEGSRPWENEMNLWNIPRLIKKNPKDHNM
jgi:hypothetical protein